MQSYLSVGKRLLAPIGCLLLTTVVARAQAPVITGSSPVNNARTAPLTTGVRTIFDQPLRDDAASAVRVFSAQAGGQQAGSATVSGAALDFAPATPFKAGELVRVTTTTGVSSAAGTALARPRVWQFTTATSPASGSFTGGASVPTGYGLSSVVTGDIDGDGDLDLLGANGNTNSVCLRRNDGSGAFAGTDSIGVGYGPSCLALADVDGDGDLDVLTANLYSGDVTIHRNDGTGAFAEPDYVVVGDGPASLAAADLDGDGDLDLLTANVMNNTVSVRFNDGEGHFSGTAALAVGHTPTSLTTGDVDGDGDLDVLTANFDDNTVSVLLNGGAGEFSSAPTVRVSTGPLSVALADIDGDGDLDLLAATYTSNTVSVRLNNGSGTFSGGSDPRLGDHPVALAVADVDGDGDLDILTANEATNTVWMRPNNGAGQFGSIVGTPVGAGPVAMALADLDGDGDLDLLTANNTAAEVSVRFNRARLPLIGGFTPASGEAGEAVTITGQYFGDVSSVRFNGVLAAFTLNSPTSLTATVPAGVTNGRLTVTTTGGTATSAGAFTALLPVVSSCSVASGFVGTSLTITGNYLANATAVKFNGVPAAQFTVNSATSISVVVPAEALSGKISVSSPTGTGTSANTFRVLAVVSEFSPASGAPGSLLTIKGTGFTEVSTVKINSFMATGFTIVDANTITVEVPAAAVSGKVAVVNPGGTATSAASFVVTPTISSFTPVQGAPGSVVLVTGNNFVSGTTVRFNGIAAATTYNSATQLTAVVPAGAGTGLLTVSSAAGTTTSVNAFRVMTGAAPTITSITPTAGVAAGTVVTITGTNMGSTTDVRFGIYSASTYTVVSATKLQAIVPPMAVSGRVFVVSPDGMAQSTISLTIIQPATITAFAPAAGPAGTVVTLSGTNFTNATAVTFGGVAATYAVVNATTITATVPAGALSGALTVTTLAGTATSAASFSAAGLRMAQPTSTPPTIAPLTLYPNPARDVVRVRVEGSTAPVTLHDATGRVVATVLPAEDGEATLAVGSLPKGIYAVRNGGLTQRLVVE